MTSSLLASLDKLNLQLPAASMPGGSYQSVNVRNKIAYVAIQFPIWNEEFRFRGRFGEDLTTKDGYQAAALCALNVLAQVELKIGFDNVEGLNHLDAYYVGYGSWDEAPKVTDGASDLFAKVLVDKGRHSRALFGVAHLPRNFSFGLTTTFTLLNPPP